MKNSIAEWRMVIWLALPCVLAHSVAAQTNATTEEARLAAEERDGCARNLKVIYAAIQSYRADHKEMPNWLSDLVPKYISDVNVFICPACKRTGEVETSNLSDPKIPSSYLYQFCPVPLGKKDAPNDPTKTRADWRRRQMALAGSIVPIVRCWHHGKVLNLAFDGRIYDSPPSWENVVSSQVDIAELKPSRLFATPSSPADAPPSAAFPPRDPKARPELIDLSAYYNASLAESWQGNLKNNLASLPTGVQKFAGVEYDVRGLIQVGGKARSLKRFPTRVDGIKIQQKCSRLHFLHSADFGNVTNDGQQIGRYIVHFATNQMQLEIPIIYGRDVRNWLRMPDETPAADLSVAWVAVNEASPAPRRNMRLFTTTWVNVAPGVEIESVDFVSDMGLAAPFLIAITAD